MVSKSVEISLYYFSTATCVLLTTDLENKLQKKEKKKNLHASLSVCFVN